MKILIMHHVEPIWDSALRNYAGISFEDLCQMFIEHFQENQYDRVILTQFENFRATNEHLENGIAYYVDQWEDYGYGWDRECWDDQYSTEGIDYCEGGQHSETVMLTDWMRELKDHDVYISGAFDGECIEDLEIALDYLGVEYKRISHLII